MTRWCVGVLALWFLSAPDGFAAATVSGERSVWHRVEVRFAGPVHAESDAGPNPFLDYRLQCHFEGPSGQRYEVAGFFDSDGQGGPRGDVWTCRFAPDEAGAWSYRAAFRQGPAVAVSLAANAGTAVAFDGETGAFFVSASRKTGDDFRAPLRGRLVNPGGHYLTFLGSGDRWLKGGPNIPENLLGYAGFDNTPQGTHRFAAHVGDWRPGDPDWNGGAGRGLIGALNYLADRGANSIYFLPMNVGGDGRDTYPTLSEQDKTHFDTSKLAQWEQVFTHATSRGIFLHVQLAETEPANENYHDGGQLGPERKLFYRELVARFAHHPGLEWNLGEENDYGSTRRRAFAAHLKALDPYDHPVTTHTYTDAMEHAYTPLLGNGDFDITSFQVTAPGFRQGELVESWRERSARAGTPWVVSIDEPQTIHNDVDDTRRGYPHGRTTFLWPTYMSGGGGFEWYVQRDGGGHQLDQQIDDFREMESALTWTGHALSFFNALPFWQMTPRSDLGDSTEGGKTFVMVAPGDSYALYHPAGGSLSIDLASDTGAFAVRWFDPKTGTWSDGGRVVSGGVRTLGSAPFAGDVAALLTREPGDGGNQAPVASFTATPLRGPAPLGVLFDAFSSFDDSGVTSYDWDFGDGASASGVSPQHTYTTPGSYTARLTVTDAQGLQHEVDRTLHVEAPATSTPPASSPAPPPPASSSGSPDSPADSAAPPSGEPVAPPPPAAPPAPPAPTGNPPAPPPAPTGNPPAPPSAPTASPPALPAPSPESPTPPPSPSIPSPGPWVPWSAPSAPSPNAMVLYVSGDSARGFPVPLEGAELAGEQYIFLEGGGRVDAVRFSLNGRFVQRELFAPYDFAGGSVAAAEAFDTSSLRDGIHTITAVVDSKGAEAATISASFGVRNRTVSKKALPAGPAPPLAAGPAVTELLVSRTATRDEPHPLAGATLAGDVFVFLPAQAAPTGNALVKVAFYLDDPEAIGSPVRVERVAPYDLGGGSVARAFQTLRTELLGPGLHRVDADLLYQDGTTLRVTAPFEVLGSSSDTPTLLVSADARRTDPIPLEGQTLGGDVWIFLPAHPGVQRVRFFLDRDPETEAPTHTERQAPYDLRGGNVRSGNPLRTESLQPGEHELHAETWLVSGAILSTTAHFHIGN